MIGTRPDDYIENCAQYVSLVRSQILDAVVSRGDRLIDSQNPDLLFGLFIALTAYFCVRTDFELKRRCLHQSFRDEVWSTLLDSTLAEMGFPGQERKVDMLRLLVLHEMGIMGGVIESNGMEDIQIISESIFITIKFFCNMKPFALEFDKIIFKNKFAALLREYQNCVELLDPDE